MRCNCATNSDYPGMEHQDGCRVVGTRFHVVDDIKMLRETLATAQHAIQVSNYGASRKDGHVQRLQRLINECDRHRPLGLGGNHGNLHTDTCGCEDKGPRETWGTVTPLVAGLISEAIRPKTEVVTHEPPVIIHGAKRGTYMTWCNHDFLIHPRLTVSYVYVEVNCLECRHHMRMAEL